MDSLLASYGSDDEDEQEEEKSVAPGSNAASQAPPPKVSLFGRLPAPRNSGSEASSVSLFASLPPPQFEAKKDVVKSEADGAAQNPKVGLSAKLPPLKEEEFGTGYRNPTDSFSKPSLFAALPPPKVEEFVGNPNDDNSASQPSLFAALPPPKVEFDSSRVKAELSYSNPKVKKQPVAFKPPIDVSILEDDDDDWRPAQKKPKAEPRSTTMGGGGLSSLLPAPKHTLGLGSTLGAGPTSGGRRAAMEVVARPSTQDVKTESAVANSRISIAPSNVKDEAHASQDQLQYDNSTYAVDEIAGFVPQVQHANEPYGWTSTQSAQEIPHNVTSHYESQNWQYSGNVSSYSSPASYASANSAPVATPVADPVAQVLQSERRRGREDRMVAPNVIEVKQADLTGGAKLREDQIRTTGIAFGPAYQPVSSKDKPSKLQRRKHQIGTLLQDSKAREMDLLDRRAKGNLTKAETQAKYGW